MYLGIQVIIGNCHLYWAWNFVGGSHQIVHSDKEMNERMLIEPKCDFVMTSIYLIET